MADETLVTSTPAPAPPANTGGATGSWDEPTPTERFIHSAATAAIGAAKGAAGVGKEILFPEGDTEVAKVKDIAKKLVIDPAAKMEMKAQTAKTPAESIGYSIAEGLPVIGPYIADTAEQVGRQAGKGDLAGAAGTVVGNILAAKAGEEIGEAAKTGADHPAVSEQLAKLGTHLNATARTALESAGEGVKQIATAQAPASSPESGFARLGGKQVRPASPKLAESEPKPEKFTEVGGKFVGEAPKAPTPSTGYSVPTEKLQKMPESAGRPEVHTIRHELGHALVGQKEGLTQKGVISDSHPLASSAMRAAVEWDTAGMFDPTTHNIRPEKVSPYVRTLMGGVASDEAFNDLPRSANHNLFLTKGGDGTRAYKILRAAGFNHEGALDEMHKAIDDGKEYLTHPTVSGIIKENENTRETGLSPQYHYSPDRLQNMHTEIQRRINSAKE